MSKIFNIPMQTLLNARAGFIRDMSYCALGIVMGMPSPVYDRRNKCRTWGERIIRNRETIEAINHELIMRGAMVGAAIFDVEITRQA